MVGIQTCGVPSDGATTSYGVVVSYGSIKQKVQLSFSKRVLKHKLKESVGSSPI